MKEQQQQEVCDETKKKNRQNFGDPVKSDGDFYS